MTQEHRKPAWPSLPEALHKLSSDPECIQVNVSGRRVGTLLAGNMLGQLLRPRLYTLPDGSAVQYCNLAWLERFDRGPELQAPQTLTQTLNVCERNPAVDIGDNT